MPNSLLIIQTSPRVSGSIVNDLTHEFSFKWQLENVAGDVVYRNLSDNPVPHLSISDFHEEHQKLQNDLISELLSSDHIFISTPMWNWGPPSVLKAYLDFIIQPGRLDTGENQNLSGKKVTILITQGGSCSADSPKAGWDYLTGYLELIAKGLGSEDVETISVEFTLADKDSKLAEFLPRKEQSLKNALNRIEKRAKPL